MSFEKVAFEKDSSKALRDKKLKKALVNVTDRFRAARLRASSQVDDWNELRARGREIKKGTIENLDKYLLMLEESVKRAGGKVHWAKDASEACDIIINIARIPLFSSPRRNPLQFPFPLRRFVSLLLFD